MKKPYCWLLFAVLFFGFSSFRPDFSRHQYTKTQIEMFVREVYAGQSDALFFGNDPGRLDVVSNLLRRMEILEAPQLSRKIFKLLSSVKLINKYNPGLKRDELFDASTFNPLKYDFPVFSKSKEVFRIDGTDFLIIIEAAN